MAGLVLPDAVALGPDTGAPGLGVVWGRSQVEDPGRSRCERGHRPAGLPKHAPPARLLRGRAGPQPQAHFPFKLGLQPVSPALPMRARLGSGGRALWSGLVPAGWQVHPRRTGGAAPGPSPEAPAAPLRSAGGDHSGSRRGCPEKALAAPWTPAALPPGPSLALASGRKCQQRPLQRCRPGHSFHRARGSASPGPRQACERVSAGDRVMARFATGATQRDWAPLLLAHRPQAGPAPRACPASGQLASRQPSGVNGGGCAGPSPGTAVRVGGRQSLAGGPPAGQFMATLGSPQPGSWPGLAPACVCTNPSLIDLITGL